MSRDVLSPPIIHMGTNRCYRVNIVHEDFGNINQHQLEKSHQGYVEQVLYNEDDDEEDLTNCLFEEFPNGVFKLTMHVAQSFYGGIIGFKGTTKRRIETETHTEIFIPRNHIGGSGKHDENVVIKGSRSNICVARRKIILLINSLRKRMPVTHFVGVALNFGEIRSNFIQFKKQILDDKLPGIYDNLFQKEEKLHLTLTVCVLLDDAERAKASDLLQSCREYLTTLQTPFTLKVNGLEIMNDDPSAVRIMYARIEAPELQKFSDHCFDVFLRSNLALDEFSRKSVKMHMTLLNVKFSKLLNDNAPNSFDARQILKQYSNFNFGTIQCNEVKLCIRGAYLDYGDDRGFYKTSSSLKL